MIETASWLCRALFSLATLLAAGSSFIACFTALNSASTVRVLRRICAGSACVSITFGFLWTAVLAAELGDEWQASFDPFFYQLIWTSPSADLLLWRGLAMFALLSWAIVPSCPRWLAINCALVAVLSFTQYGHSLAEPQWLKSVLLTAHLSIIAWWLAVVPALFVLLKTSASDALALAERFAIQAKWAVAVAILSGLSFLGFQLAAFQWDLDSLYAKTILIKLIVVSIIMSIAAVNHLRLIPALKTAKARAKERLSSILILDAALFATVVFLSTWLTGPASNT